jgi:hypothetical protein
MLQLSLLLRHMNIVLFAPHLCGQICEHLLIAAAA